MFVLSSLVVLKKWGEFSSKYDGEVGSGGSVLYHVERSTVQATWKSSGESGVEGVVGDGEREVVAVCEDEEEAMIDERERGRDGGEMRGGRDSCVRSTVVSENQDPIISELRPFGSPFASDLLFTQKYSYLTQIQTCYCSDKP
jgi:hypothetical protein